MEEKMRDDLAGKNAGIPPRDIREWADRSRLGADQRKTFKEPEPFLGAPVPPDGRQSLTPPFAPEMPQSRGKSQSRESSRRYGKNAQRSRYGKNVKKAWGGQDDAETPQQESVEEKEEQQEQRAEILETGGITTRKGKYPLHCLTIIGQIEGHYILPAQNKTTKYEHVIPQLLAVEQDPEIRGLVVILNTVGGDVEAGLAIAELLSGMKKPTVSLVLGGGHSIGVPLAVSARKSFIAPSATMTVHPVRMNGLMLGVPQTLSYFDRMQERIINFVTGNSSISPERFRALMMNKDELVMDVGSVLDGQAAVEEGLIDSLGGIADVIRALYDMIEQEDREK